MSLPDNRLRQPLARLFAQDHGDWQPLLARWAASPAGQATVAAVDARVGAGAQVYPADVLAALRLTPLAATRVVILGQDPYHGPGQAEGLAFSVAPGLKLPPSLRNIGQELQRDLGLPALHHGSLRGWAAQGVLLLNSVLTVEDGEPAAHTKLGWQALTSAVIEATWRDASPKAYLLWGAHAQALLQQVAAERAAPQHLVLRANHPSPLSARRPPVPFLGCGHFSAANAFLAGAGRKNVEWGLARD
jgi:uracil-DNA glycosylase